MAHEKTDAQKAMDVVRAMKGYQTNHSIYSIDPRYEPIMRRGVDDYEEAKSMGIDFTTSAMIASHRVVMEAMGCGMDDVPSISDRFEMLRPELPEHIRDFQPIIKDES